VSSGPPVLERARSLEFSFRAHHRLGSAHGPEFPAVPQNPRNWGTTRHFGGRGRPAAPDADRALGALPDCKMTSHPPDGYSPVRYPGSRSWLVGCLRLVERASASGPKTMRIIKTERCICAPLTESDFPNVAKLYKNHQVRRFSDAPSGQEVSAARCLRKVFLALQRFLQALYLIPVALDHPIPPSESDSLQRLTLGILWLVPLAGLRPHDRLRFNGMWKWYQSAMD
jgi:hypothetical protein